MQTGRIGETTRNTNVSTKRVVITYCLQGVLNDCINTMMMDVFYEVFFFN